MSELVSGIIDAWQDVTLDIAQISRLGHQLWQGIGKGTYSIVATI